MKKIELHLHLDGSINIDYASKLLGRDRRNELIGSNSTSLADYLKRFDLPIELLQDYDNIIEFCYLLGKDLVNDGVIYAEVRFCPLFHNKYISVDRVITAIRIGFSRVKDLKVNLIFCMMRHFSFEDNLKIINLAKKYLGNGCCAIDLAGSEAQFPTKDFEELFKIAKKENIPFTIHAGEADGPSSLMSAIKFGTKRIGHGVRCVEDEEVIKLIRDNNIYLEVCPTSNIDTKTFNSMKEHSIKELVDNGLLVTISTDNRTVSNTNLSNEYKILHDTFNFDDEDFLKFNLNAIDAAFLSDEEKEELRRRLVI